MTSNLDKTTRAEIELEQKIIKEVLKDEYAKELKIIFETYQALIEVVRVFCEQFPNFDPKLNKYYIQLTKILDINVNKVHSELDERMSKHLLPWSYVHAEVFEDLGYFRPFKNLFTAEDELGQIDWQRIRPSMNSFLGNIGPILKEVKNRDKIQIINQKLLTEIEKYLNKNKPTSTGKITVSKISYNSQTGEMLFSDKSIQMPLNTYQDALCRVLLKNEKTMRKAWTWDELLEKWGGKDFYEGKQLWRKVYNAGREVNQKIAAKTAIEDFLLITTKEISVNPKYP